MPKIAVIQTGGKQYIVKKGDVVSVEKMSETDAAGGKVVFQNVLLVDDGSSASVGAPYVSGATVEGEIVETGRGKKLSIVRFRPKSRYTRRVGHRQSYTKVKITNV